MLPRSMLSGDRRAIAQLQPNHVFHAASRVIERRRLDSLALAKKIAALVQSYRMRKHLPDVLQLRSRSGDQVVLDAQPHLSTNKNVAFHQQIKVLGDRSSQRVLDRNHGTVSPASIP